MDLITISDLLGLVMQVAGGEPGLSQNAKELIALPQELTEGMEALKAEHILELQLRKDQLSAAVRFLSHGCCLYMLQTCL